MPKKRKRLLIFVIAYYAESTLRKVLERIPREIFDDYDSEILIVDDASTDRTFAIGRDYQSDHPDVRMTVLRNAFNQGYGGNQKVGYTFAIREGFDYVAMLHGDGQYAPEALPMLMASFDEGAGAVFGSRMLEPKAALAGGMPLYKFVGNRILSAAQNFLLGSRLSEFHSGYRVYAVATLARLPFQLNSNDFHFDTEIIIQLLNAQVPVIERPIPTYYGDEICRVNGMKYAKDVMLATLANSAHRAGLLYQRRFDTARDSNAHYDLKLGYTSSHTLALAAVKDGARVVDIGAGPGGMAKALVDKRCEVMVVDQFPTQEKTPHVEVVVQDLEAPIAFETRRADYLLMLDVIEHLRDPERFLHGLRETFDYAPRTLVLSTPNIAFIVQRLMLLAGQFNYGKAGILDRTHTRLFTFRSLRQLLEDEGFRIKSIRGVPAPFPKVFGNGATGRGLVRINEWLIGASKTLFSYQIFVEAETTPTTDFVLESSKAHSGVVPITRLRDRAELRRRVPRKTRQ
jgi:glycosyltransferase involved in cell wall biosynthesis